MTEPPTVLSTEFALAVSNLAEACPLQVAPR